MPSPIHAFSFGADGKSDTNGNDLDDINSWNYDPENFYGRLIANDLKREYLWRTLWVTPINYTLILLTLHALKRSKETE